MRKRHARVTTALAVLSFATAVHLTAQVPTPPQQTPVVDATTRGGRGRAAGDGAQAVFPAQQRPPADVAVVSRGLALYGISCRSCHGPDLRGGDLGGPNLLRSQVVLSDQDGELILPIIRGSRQTTGMPPMSLPDEDVKAVAAYLHSVVAGIGNQGTPPSIGAPVATVLVGDARAGRAFFATTCGTCHSATGDLQGIGTRIADAKALQNAWVSGNARSGGRATAAGAPNRRTVTVTVTEPGGAKVEGRLVRIDDFLVSVGLADGSIRTILRRGLVPKVDVRDPMKAHRDLLAVYTDTNVHDVTAYLVTLK